jgi:hypothetical protein
MLKKVTSIQHRNICASLLIYSISNETINVSNIGKFKLNFTFFTRVSLKHNSITNVEWLLPEVVLIQFVSPDDEHYVLETCREL